MLSDRKVDIHGKSNVHIIRNFSVTSYCQHSKIFILYIMEFVLCFSTNTFMTVLNTSIPLNADSLFAFGHRILLVLTLASY